MKHVKITTQQDGSEPSVSVADLEETGGKVVLSLGQGTHIVSVEALSPEEARELRKTMGNPTSAAEQPAEEGNTGTDEQTSE